MRTLRIGIACYPTYGGSGVLATELGQALARRGHEIHLFSYARPGRLSYCHGLEFHNVSVSSYPLFRFPPYDLALASVMRQVMADRSLDILHVHYAVPHALCAYLARQMCNNCHTKIVTTLHGTDITILGRDPAYRDVIPFGLRQSDAVISVSEWLREQTRDVFAYDGPIHVVPNFVDHERFRPAADGRVRAELGGDRRPLVVHMSNFRPLKRARDTVEILRRVDPAIRPRLVLVGDGPDLALVREDAAKQGLGQDILFLGEIDNVEAILAASDLALFPSATESFGLAALEAMACGLPVVATRTGGLPEVVLDGSTGFLHGVGDCAGMARSIETLLGDSACRHAMGEAARRRAQQDFSLSASLRRHEELYFSLRDHG